MKAIRFTIDTIPVGQMRARHTARGGFSRTYKAKKQRVREETMAALMAQYAPAEPMDGPLVLVVDCFLPIPKSRPRAWRQDASTGAVRPITNPDADNLAKHIKDVMTQLRFYEDDRQVVDLRIAKWYSDRPRWVVTLRQWEPDALSIPWEASR